MKVPKGKMRVRITCKDDTLVEGVIYVREGLRIIDDLNISGEPFKVITSAKFSNVKIMPFGLHRILSAKKKDFILLNKSSIKWVEEIKQ